MHRTWYNISGASLYLMSYRPIVYMQSGNDPLPITVCSTHTHILGGPFTIQIEAIGIVATLWPICGTYFLLLDSNTHTNHNLGTCC